MRNRQVKNFSTLPTVIIISFFRSFIILSYLVVVTYINYFASLLGDGLNILSSTHTHGLPQILISVLDYGTYIYI